ncbi:MAG: hypothetical protein QF464_14350, partial [Myxococcota bacterium]|nr:hypothetical protein [Myxococcota bacterium]
MDGAEGSLPAGFAALGDFVYFAASGAEGRELWRADEAGEGASLFVDLREGLDSSEPDMLTERAGKLYFVADDGVNGRELWMTDGSVAGTAMVTDLREGPEGAAPTQLVAFKDHLYFVADDGLSGPELWRTDGTAEGTELFDEIQAGPDGSAPDWLTVAGGQLFFVADDGVDGRELWRTEGMLPGTRRVRDIAVGAADAAIADLAAIGRTLYFVADDGVNGLEPWLTDGTQAATRLATDVVTGAPGSAPSSPVILGRNVYVAANSETGGRQLLRLGLTEPPSVALVPTILTYTEDADPLVLYPSATLTDDNEEFRHGSITVRVWEGKSSDHRIGLLVDETVGVEGDQVLVDGIAVATVTGSGVGLEHLVITMNDSEDALRSAAETLIRHLTFATVDQAPTGVVKVGVLVGDGMGGLSDPASRSILLAAENDPPVGDDVEIETLEDTPLEVDLTSLAEDADGDVLTVKFLDVQGGVVELFVAGELFEGTVTSLETGDVVARFTAPQDAHEDNGSPFSFRLVYSDGESDVSLTVTVVVTAIDDPPVTTD